MKRKDLLLLTFLLSQTTPVWAMLDPETFDARQPINHMRLHQPSAEQAQRLKESINEGLAKTEEMLTQHNSLEPKVVVIGPTKSGKSTLVNLLAGKELRVDEDLRIDVINAISGSEPGHDERMSHTVLPSLCMGPNNTVLCDCPGFGDTGGPEFEIVNLGMINRVLSAGPVKILLTVSDDYLVGTGTPFLNLIRSVAKTFPFAQLKNGLSLVITRQGASSTVRNPHAALRRLLVPLSQTNTNSRNETYAMTEDVRSLLTHLTEEQNIRTRILYFPYPNEPGEYQHTEAVKANILESIQLLQPIQNPDLKIELSPESSLLVMRLANDINNNIETSIKNIVIPKVLKVCKRQATGNMEGLQRNVRTVQSAFEFLTNDSTENMANFATSFDDFFDQNNNVLKENVKTLMFLKALKSDDITYSTGAWESALHPIWSKIYTLIDTIADTLFQKVTHSVDAINSSVMQCYTPLPNPESNNGEDHIEKLTEKLLAINETIAALQRATPENMNGFIRPLIDFFPDSDSSNTNSFINAIENPTESPFVPLWTLNSLKEINYPKGRWLSSFNASVTHLQNAITTQQAIQDLRTQRERLAEDLEQRQRQIEAEAAAKRDLQQRFENESRRQAEALQQQQRQTEAEVVAKQRLQQQFDTERQSQERAESERQRQAEERAELLRQLEKERQAQTTAAVQQLDQANLTQQNLTQQVQGLTQQVATVTREKEGVVQQLGQANQAKQNLTQQLTEANQAKRNLDQQLAAVTREKDNLTGQVDVTIKREKGTTQQLAAVTKEKEKIEKVASELKRESEAFNRAYTDVSQLFGIYRERTVERELSLEATLKYVREEKERLAHDSTSYYINDIRLPLYKQDTCPSLQMVGKDYLVTTGVGTSQYQLMSERIPLQNFAKIHVPFQVELKRGSFSVGLLSNDQTRWIINEVYTTPSYLITTADGLLTSELQLPTGTTESGVYLVFTSCSETPVQSVFKVKNYSIRTFTKK